MHIFEGFLPSPWWQLWFVFSIPIIFFGMYRLNKLVSEKRELLPL
ncbi:cobalamin biosynthesis protein CbiM, partial [Methanococcoides sp. SA1]|nr:cobalamin biosynthesis protein CbiM [Methanococcoides sp. SA1]